MHSPREQADAQIIVPIVFAVLSTAIYGTRVYARRISKSRFGVDDVLMGVGLFLSYGLTISTVIMAFNGVGYRTSKLPAPEQTRQLFASYLTEKFWPTSLAFVKCSVIVFMQRIFRTNRAFYIASTTMIILISCRAFSAIIVNTFQCSPVAYAYDASMTQGTCIAQTQFFEAMAACSLIEDFAVLVLPLPVLWGLQMDDGRKLALTLIFSTGLLVSVLSLMRIVEFRNFIIEPLPIYNTVTSIATALEVNLAIICGCLPTLQPLTKRFARIFPSSFFSSRGKGSSNPQFQFIKSSKESSGAFESKNSDGHIIRNSKGGVNDQDGQDEEVRIYGTEAGKGGKITGRGDYEGGFDSPSAMEMGTVVH